MSAARLSRDHARGMKRSIFFCFAILVGACGTTPNDPPPGGDPTSCGTAGAKTGSECTGLGNCGAGMQNFVKVSFCDHCFARADTHFCEAGTCRMLSPGTMTNVSYAIVIPASLTATTKSYTVASVNPIAADGSHLTCESLMKASCEIDSNGGINARNSRFNPVGTQGDLYMGLISADAGAARMIFVQLTDAMQGSGNLLAWGCATIDVVEGMNNGPIEVMIKTL